MFPVASLLLDVAAGLKSALAGELYLKGCASPTVAANTLQKRELAAEGSVQERAKCSLVGRAVSAVDYALEEVGFGDPFSGDGQHRRVGAKP